MIETYWANFEQIFTYIIQSNKGVYLQKAEVVIDAKTQITHALPTH